VKRKTKMKGLIFLGISRFGISKALRVRGVAEGDVGYLV
jgi:hypothetical protein